MASEGYRNLIVAVKALLPDYLESRGIDPSKSFHCINPDHQDTDPSCSLVPLERTRFHCFSCGISGDSMMAAHLLEGLPTSGPEFVTDNVCVLASRFGVPYESVRVSNEDRTAAECYRAFELATYLLSGSEDGSVAQAVYGWNLAEVRKVVPSIGTVDWASFAKKMKSLGGYTQVYLETQFGVTPQLFGSNLLTLAIKNKNGTTVGFAARDCRYESSPRIAKWKNTSADVSIYKKGSILYGIDATLDDDGPIYLVEGYSDVIRLRLLGLQNVFAYCGSSISEHQAVLIEKLGRTDLIIVPDRDRNGAGDNGIIRSLDKVFKDFPRLRIKIKELPFPDSAEKIDPGIYLATHTLAEFLALDDQESFQWRLRRFPSDMPTDEIYDQAMPLICDDKNPVRQQRMLRQLAEKTGVEYLQLQRNLEDALAERRKQGRKKAQRLISLTKSQLDDTDPKEAPGLLRKAADQIEDVQIDKYQASDHGPEEFASFIQELKKTYEASGTGLPGWTTGFPSVDTAFGGLPRKECMMTIAGDTNGGKSNFVQNIGLQIALNNKNTAVLLFSIDDSRGQTTPRLLSQMTSLPIAAIKSPNNPKYGLTDAHKKSLDLAWGDLKAMINYGRLDVKDASQGTSIDFARSWVRDTRRRHPNWDILFILDSFNKLTGVSGDGSREKIEAASQAVASLTKQEGVTALCTAELRKRLNPMQRPYIDDVKGSNQMGYDSTVVILLHNSMHSNPSGKKDQVEFWVDSDGQEKPVIQLHVNKNKETSYKGMFRMRLRPETSQLLEIPLDEASTQGWDEPSPID